MCTVSIVAHAGGLRLMCNRDERPDRPEALPPAVFDRTGGGWMTYPIDPAGGGTWLGANDRGLVLALLNQSSAVPPETPRASRGVIIPALLAANDLRDVVAALRWLDPSRHAPFRLLAVQGRERLVASRAGRSLAGETRLLESPFFMTSSSLGDLEAERQRRPWFDRLVRDARDPVAGQQRLHDGRWTTDPRFGVWLSRDEARTVSQSTIDVDADGRVAGFSYVARPAADLAA